MQLCPFLQNEGSVGFCLFMPVETMMYLSSLKYV